MTVDRREESMLNRAVGRRAGSRGLQRVSEVCSSRASLADSSSCLRRRAFCIFKFHHLVLIEKLVPISRAKESSVRDASGRLGLDISFQSSQPFIDREH